MRRSRGFTLIEITIVVGIISIISVIAIPQLMSSRLSANETMAIATLTSLRTVQAEFRQACVVDQDKNGVGEYGLLQELAGGAVPRGGVSGRTPGEFISQQLGSVASNGIATKDGYSFLVYLPTSAGVARNEGQFTVGRGTAAFAPLQETWWCCYAWPTNRGQTGNRAFCVNQTGVVYQTLNNLPTQCYTGTTFPQAQAAFVDVPGNPPIANLGGRFPRLGTTEVGADGGIWLPAN